MPVAKPIVIMGAGPAGLTAAWQLNRAGRDAFWQLVRTPEGWRTAYRTNRLINGSAAARELLGRAQED